MKNHELNTFKSQLKDLPFKTAFKATLGFYAAQALITFIAVVGVGVILFITAIVLK